MSGNYSWQDPQIQAALHAGNSNTDDAVERAHLMDVPELAGSVDDQIVPGVFFDTANNLAGAGNTLLEVFTIPGVVIQRVTGIDSGTIGTRRQYAGTWSVWATHTPNGYFDPNAV